MAEKAPETKEQGAKRLLKEGAEQMNARIHAARSVQPVTVIAAVPKGNQAMNDMIRRKAGKGESNGADSGDHEVPGAE